MDIGKDTQFRSGADAAKKGRNGGIKSGEVRRQKKAMQEMAKIVLGLKANISKNAELQLKRMGVQAEDMTMQTVALVKAMEKAAKGDIRALEFLRDTAGEKPTDKLDVIQSAPARAKVEIIVEGLNMDDDDTDEA